MKTIEQKAKAYDEAIDKVAHFIKKHIGFGCMIHPNSSEAKELFNIFPELKESEDEKIRKFTIYIIQHHTSEQISSKDKQKCITWLEKQGEKPQGKSALDAINEEKVDNANKVEPKFKVGDWITDGKALLYITKFEIDYGYELKAIDGKVFHSVSPDLVEANYHLWTIEDTKDGDVLEASDGSIFLFKCVVDSACKHYIGLTTDGVIEFNKGLEHYWEISRAVHPATKEQRDLLFQKMKESGYEWDAEKKELIELKTLL